MHQRGGQPQMNEQLIKFLEKTKTCSQCKDSPTLSVEYAVKILKDGKVETEKADLCRKDWNRLAETDISWSVTP
jgi:hypothetical protein